VSTFQRLCCVPLQSCPVHRCCPVLSSVSQSYAATAPWKDHCSLSSPTSARAAGHRVEAPLSASRSSSSGKENRYPAASAYHYHSTQQQQQQQQQQQAYLLTVTVGSKPSDADAWLPGVDAVVSLLRTLGRVVSGCQAASPRVRPAGTVDDLRW